MVEFWVRYPDVALNPNQWLIYMEMLPITYRQLYSDMTCAAGFTPHRNKDGDYITERWIDIIPSTWTAGACLVVEVKERICKQEGGYKEHQLIHKWIYDRPSNYLGQKVTDDEVIVPTDEQGMLMMALASQELRGKYAENIVHGLYIDLIVLNPKFGLEAVLPEVVKFYTEHYEKYGFKRKSG
jgi:hypothetical protein